MNIPLGSVLFVVIAVSVSSAEIHLEGDISGTKFTPDGNPYIVDKDIIVPAESTVVIPEGCVLLFNTYTGLKVDGRLVVTGREKNPVVFTSIHDLDYDSTNAQLPNPFDWNGIFVTDQSDGSFLNNFHLRYSVYGIKSRSNNVVIQNGVFRQNGQFHFTVDNEIQLVQDDIPFSYGEDEIPPALADLVPVAEGTPDTTAQTRTSPKSRKRRKGFIIGAIATGATAAVVVPVLLLCDDTQNEKNESAGW
ncbi:MAG: hypothetical protein GF344_03830 [Chitinivibrionales bacterium]|nr:hypothetical protein [Chitinivibrionales bacterium]MBD3356185.1 hypothetical protein [Chitinivibrionales bacterium]